MFKRVSLDKIEEGMILTSAQVNKYGQVLLAKGTKIKNSHIKILRTWGVDSIMVLDESEPEIESEHFKRVKAEVEKSLKVRMLFEPSNIYEVDMFRATIEYKMRAE